MKSSVQVMLNLSKENKGIESAIFELNLYFVHFNAGGEECTAGIVSVTPDKAEEIAKSIYSDGTDFFIDDEETESVDVDASYICDTLNGIKMQYYAELNKE